jgi:hypothetical protein
MRVLVNRCSYLEWTVCPTSSTVTTLVSSSKDIMRMGDYSSTAAASSERRDVTVWLLV